MPHRHDDNKRVVRYIFEELLPKPQLGDEIAAVVSEDFIDHDPIHPDHARGVDALRATHAALHARWGGKVHFTIEDIIGEGDMVAMRWSAGSAQAHAWFRLRDGKLVDRWAILRHTQP